MERKTSAQNHPKEPRFRTLARKPAISAPKVLPEAAAAVPGGDIGSGGTVTKKTMVYKDPNT